MATRITPSQLDFTSIKQNLKTYFKDSGEFDDYNFEGSGLSAILDVLAYDTHFKALTANFALNEAFLDTAQLRGSVVSHAKSLNYLPSSRTSAQAVLTVTPTTVPYTLPKYSLFTTQIDGKSYSFYTLDQYEITSLTGANVTVYEGTLITKRFIVDADINDNPVYVIPDSNVYTDSLIVQTREGLDSTSVASYRRAKKIEDFASNQRIYFVNESANGYYEITFGDGVVGFAPPEGSIIEVKYLSSNAGDANSAAIFSTGLSGLNTSTVTSAYGGSEKESIESIRFNAPKSFAAQDRAITESDFVALVQNYFSNVESINVYGGQKAYPPQYGKVFVAIKPVGAETLTQVQKDDILVNALNDRVILSVTPEIVDPAIQYIAINASVIYDETKTTLTKNGVEDLVDGVIVQFGTDNLLGFQSPLRRSSLMTAIDASAEAILSSDVSIELQKRFVPVLNTSARYELKFSSNFASVNSKNYILTSNEFGYIDNNVSYTCRLRNKTGTTQLEIYRTGSTGDVIVVDDAGSIDYANKLVSIVPFSPSSISTDIRINVVPESQNIINPNLNILLRIDENNIVTTAIKDV
jgi:hypothetical protein